MEIAKASEVPEVSLMRVRVAEHEALLFPLPGTIGSKYPNGATIGSKYSAQCLVGKAAS